MGARAPRGCYDDQQPQTVKDVLMMSARAALKREIADNMSERGDYHACYRRPEATEMDKWADDFLDLDRTP